MAEKTISISCVQGKANSPEILDSVGVIQDEGAFFVSSKDVALHFQKKHQHVLRDIGKILSISPKSFHASNFRPMFIDVEIGNGATRKDPAYLLTRDAFSLLAMGFTGPAAIRWKLKYIEAFNALEAGLMENVRQAALEEGKRLALELEHLQAARAEGAAAALNLTPRERELLMAVVDYYRRGLTQAETAKLMDQHRIKVGCMATLARRMGLLPEAKQGHGAAALAQARSRKGMGNAIQN